MVSTLETLCRIPALVVISNHPDIKEEIFSYPLRLIGIYFSTFISPLEPHPLEPHFTFYSWIEALQSKVFSILKDQSIPEGTIPWDLLPFIGIEMLKWVKHLQEKFHLPVEFTKNFIKSSFFTSRGKIDEEKAARELVKEPSLPVSLQYKIACYYFFPDIAKHLWQKLHNIDPKFQRDDFERPLILWTRYFEETENPSMSKSQLEILSRNFIAEVFCHGFDNGNLSAIKFVINLESSDMLKEIEESIGSIHFTYTVNQIHNYFENCCSPREMLLSRDFSDHCDIAIYLFNFSKTEMERESFLQRFKLVFGLLKGCLMWPYQDLFMKTAISVFNNLSEGHFYRLMNYIVDMTKDTYLNYTYNYHHLLREFWIKSSLCHKKFTLKVESLRGSLNFEHDLKLERGFLLEKIMTLNNFTHDDEINFRLILKSASSEDKRNILERQGESTASDLIFKNQFKEVDMYLNFLNINEDSQKIFKERQKKRFFMNFAFKPMCLDLADKFVNWIVTPDEVDNLKEEIFLDVFKISNVIQAVFICETPVAYLTELLEWFGKTDEEIKEWKSNGVFDKELSSLILRFPDKSLINQFEIFFEWLGYTEIAIFSIKSYILEMSFPKAFFRLLESRFNAEILYQSILYFCSYNVQRVSGYVQKWKTLIEFPTNGKVCPVCGSSNHNYLSATRCSIELQNTKSFLARLMEICLKAKARTKTSVI